MQMKEDVQDSSMQTDACQLKQKLAEALEIANLKSNKVNKLKLKLKLTKQKLEEQKAMTGGVAVRHSALFCQQSFDGTRSNTHLKESPSKTN